MAAQGGDIAAGVAAALGGAKRSGTGWSARCPAHDDRKASLSLAVGDNGSLLWRCHAGCSQEAVGDALKSLDLLPAPERRERHGQLTVASAYDYVDEDGRLLSQNVRLVPKSFRQRRRPQPGDDPAKIKDGWVWSVAGVRRVPYRLPQLIAGIAAGATVWLTEGEKDADRLAAMGLVATTNAAGADNWTQAHAASLRGANVVILEDNDEAGRKRTAKIGASLKGIAASVRAVRFPALPEHGDVSDWFDAGHTVEELLVLAAAADEWRAAAPAAKADAASWQGALLKTRRGDVKAHLANAATALRHAPEWQGVLALNQLKAAIELAAPPPWEPRNGTWEVRAWGDNDDVRAAEWMQRQGIDIGHTIAHAAIAEAAERNAYHPVRRYLEGLAWDGIERVQHFGADILGSQDTPFVRAVSQAILIAAVARAMTPGCKADNIPVLEGPQGQLKSTAVRTLFEPWFTDDIADLGSKEAADQIRKTWCAEIADLAGMRRADIEKIKAFASRCVDIFRPAYGRSVIEAPRQAVMWATTNQAEWIKDDTGGRRFWPIACGRVAVKRLERERDQIWAEALHWWRKGEPWWLTDRATVELARAEQESRQVADAWDDRIAEYVQLKADVSVGEVLQFGLAIEPGKWGQTEQNRIARYLRRKGWTRRYLGPRGKQKWRYYASEAASDGQNDQLEMEYPESGL